MDTTFIFLQNMAEIISSLAEYFFVKLVWAIVLATATYLVGAEHLPLVGGLTALVAIDFATGVYAAYYLKETIESRKMVKTAIKWTLYLLMISAAHLTEGLLPSFIGTWFLAEVTIAFLGATEFVSILENIGRGGVAIPLKLLNKVDEFRNGQAKP